MNYNYCSVDDKWAGAHALCEGGLWNELKCNYIHRNGHTSACAMALLAIVINHVKAL
jgi:hypothetical protein